MGEGRTLASFNPHGGVNLILNDSWAWEKHGVRLNLMQVGADWVNGYLRGRRPRYIKGKEGVLR